MNDDLRLPDELAVLPPVSHRHAKCKQCDTQFTYWRGATNDTNGTRPTCPDCGEQGIGGPFGRVSPAEYLGVVAIAAENTDHEYRDWLAGEAVVHVDYAQSDEWLHTVRRAYLPCTMAYAVTRKDEDGEVKFSRRSAWSPDVYWEYLNNGVDVQLVRVESVPEGAKEQIR